MSFLDDVLNGKANIMEIDKYIEAWHNGKTRSNMPLRVYLGFSEEEYETFLKLENLTEEELIEQTILTRKFLERIQNAK